VAFHEIGTQDDFLANEGRHPAWMPFNLEELKPPVPQTTQSSAGALREVRCSRRAGETGRDTSKVRKSNLRPMTSRPDTRDN
jgi:hypothetical protein